MQALDNESPLDVNVSTVVLRAIRDLSITIDALTPVLSPAACCDLIMFFDRKHSHLHDDISFMNRSTWTSIILADIPY
jgi:hypothetical protein